MQLGCRVASKSRWRGVCAAHEESPHPAHNARHPPPRERAVLITPTRTGKDSPLPGERAPDEGGRMRGLFLARWTLTETNGAIRSDSAFCYLLERWLC
jgi:hypothetical protein